MKKLEWMNGVYIRELGPAEFVDRALPFVTDTVGRDLTDAEQQVFVAIAPHVQERAKLLSEVGPQVRFLFEDVAYDDDSWQKVMTKPEVAAALAGAQQALANLAPWDTPGIEAALRAMLEGEGLSARKGLQPLRVAISGSSVSPPLFESMDVLGKERTLARLAAAAERVQTG